LVVDGMLDGRVGKLENLTLWERVHRHLREEILANRLPPGTVLGEVALAESLGVSRGPVREALGRLAAEGLVTVRPRRGAVVSALGAKEFLEAYQVREALEALAIRLAVPRLTEEQLDELQGLVDEQARRAVGDDVGAFFQANSAFHQLIVEASGNATLVEMYRQLLGHMGRYRMRSLALRGTLKRSVGEHRAILRAVRSGNAERAAHLISEHIRVPQRRLESASDEEVVVWDRARADASEPRRGGAAGEAARA
jgi:DNA-binding GntR family transcriptional regulator